MRVIERPCAVAGTVAGTVAAALLTGLVAAPGPVDAVTDALPPVVAAPAAAPRPGGTITASSVPFVVSWSGTDPGSGIARYQLQRRVDGGSWETLALPSRTARSLVTGLWPPHEYRFRVRATDAAGNTGAWATGATLRVRRLAETAAGLATEGPWALRRGTDYLGDRALRSGTPGATATFTFTGSQVAWFGTRGPGYGSAQVFVDGARVATIDLRRDARTYRRIQFRHAWPASGPHTLAIRVVGTAGHPLVDIDGFVVVDPPAPDPVLVGAGDVAVCGQDGDSATARLLDGIAGRVFVAGDLAYPDGTARQFRDCYGPTWGRWRSRTSPVPGNHEYRSAGAGPYFAYFGVRTGTAGRGWYAYDLGAWRVYHLNSNCSIVGCVVGSEQVRWLQADLAAFPRQCVAAIWHHPLFSSGRHGNTAGVRPLWRALEAAGAELVVNGHDHDYERFAPQTSTGIAAPAGIREFVVGTGGAALRGFGTLKPNSQRRNAATLGVLRLTLRAGGYDWRFVPVAGGMFTDAGTATCH
ncbi:MAG: metallophosphoesterase [Chloroflexota bacterium]